MVRPTSIKTVVSRLFFSSQRPIYVLDAAGRIVFCNQALSDWTDIPEKQLQGGKCVYSTAKSQETDSWGTRLAPPPQVRELGAYRTTVSCVRKNGATSVRSVVFFSLHDADDSTLAVVDDVEVTDKAETIFDVANLHREVAAMRKQWAASYQLDHLVGVSPAMKRVRAQVRLAARAPCRVAIVGQLGSGRETIARTIHRERTQGGQMLIPLSCAILDAELLQTTIETLVKQLAELDDDTSSVLLLLEVDQLSMEAQSALLGFLEIPEFGLETLATSRVRLFELVKQGKFRAELAYHLASLEISVPPLHERIDDIPVLAQWMLERSSRQDHVGGFTPAALEALLRYGWPREAVEVREVVEESAKNAKTSLIDVMDLPRKIGFAADAAALPDIVTEQVELDVFLAEIEAELVSRALDQAKGNRAQAARALGISRGKLLRRIEQLGIES